MPDNYSRLADNAWERTSYHECPTGVFVLDGPMPEYLEYLYFFDEETAKTAVDEAIECLNQHARRSMAYMLRHTFGRGWLNGQLGYGTQPEPEARTSVPWPAD